ncbi:MAG TPA: DUF447 domain-containing protein [Candidatus Methanoperedens sp.]
MIDIEDFGIFEGISEVIFTTLSAGGKPNAAPIGLHRKDGRLFARIYNSRTLENILGGSAAASNIVDDPVLFVQSSLSDLGPEKFAFIDGFPVLKDAQGWIFFSCRCKKGENITLVELFPLKGKINQRKIRPVNRGFNAVIEASIHATRYVISKERKYLDCIKYYDTIVKKCGGAREKEAMGLIYDLIGTVL